jgi:DNA-directed RNA polymerase specialized sigma24 family protein
MLIDWPAVSVFFSVSQNWRLVAMDTHGSVTQWIAELKAGDVDAAHQELWDRYFRRLAALAKSKLGSAPSGAEDEEDVALSALRSFFVGFADGRFPRLEDRHNLWSLLAKITACKAINQRNRQLALKRGGGGVLSGTPLEREPDSSGRRQLADLVEEELTPDFIAAVNEECQILMDLLPDDKLRRIARLKLEGYTNAEIATQFDVVERTIERKLEVIRTTWLSKSEQA